MSSLVDLIFHQPEIRSPVVPESHAGHGHRLTMIALLLPAFVIWEY
jgi:hypothetical protein